MTEESLIYIVLGIAAVLVALWLILRVIRMVIAGAVGLFSLVADSGFVGVAAYVACWVFLFPVMLILSFIAGFFTWLLLRQSQG